MAEKAEVCISSLQFFTNLSVVDLQNSEKPGWFLYNSLPIYLLLFLQNSENPDKSDTLAANLRPWPGELRHVQARRRWEQVHVLKVRFSSIWVKTIKVRK